MTTALLMPTREKKAINLGRNVWRKQILKKGTIEYEGKPLVFDDALCTDLVQSFQEGAFDQVAFQLANGENQHTLDPERFRGEIKGVFQTADGLDAIIETTDSGSDVIRQNPKLGVSCRIIPEFKRADGRSFKAAIQHVLGTLDPRLNGMGAWQAVQLSSPVIDQVIDLSTATYQKEAGMPEPDDKNKKPELSKEQLAKLAELDPSKLTAEQQATLLALLPGAEGQHTKTEPGAGGGGNSSTTTSTKTEGGTGDEDFDKELKEFLAGLETADAGAGSGGAELSAETRQAIELANANAKAARDESAALRAQLELSKFEAEKDGLLRKGIPPAAVDLATPFLVGSGHVIDLSNGDKADAGQVVRGLLDMLSGTVDLSGETVGISGAPASTAERDQLLDRWRQQHPFSGEKPATASAAS